VKAWEAYPHNADVVTAYGASTYNNHPDGSGISISSRLRPILTMRPGYLTFADQHGSGLRHFSADSHITDWLHEKGFEFDVITDEDLDDNGKRALDGYDVVITGSHPEYYTRNMMEALLAFRTGGGSLMYMGGNGFYWKIARSEHAPHALEIRRAEGGMRMWASEPGEYYNQFDGEYGGMWRRNGLAPQAIAGVGFAVEGDFVGSPYLRTQESFQPEFEWLFEGVNTHSPSECIGDFGLSGGGAAGFELDQAAYDLGTPEYVSVVAVSHGHDPSFKHMPEELLTWDLLLGKPRKHGGICANMVCGISPKGGGIFASGSICFAGSLSHNNYDNNVSCIVENFLRRFL
jgi:N,N-dimethylformamidase